MLKLTMPALMSSRRAVLLTKVAGVAALAGFLQAGAAYAQMPNVNIIPEIEHKTPEQKIGALFWRMHRCARIIFSLNFHMGLWTPKQCVDFLIDRVGHEPDNAAAEVRRSFESAQYQNQPLYQAAYLLGGLQLRGLRKELVDGKLMTNQQFHDEILRQGNMPMALVRLNLTRQKLTKDMDINWKFYGELPEK